MTERKSSAPTDEAAGAPEGAKTPAPAADNFFQDALGMPAEDFLLNVAGQQAYGPHAVAARLDPADLAVMADLDYMMNHARFRGGNVQPIRGGAAIRDRRTSAAGKGPDAAYIYGQFAKGYGIRFVQVERYLPRVAGFVAELAAALAESVQANIYVTPADGEGLDLHYDSHDVFVLQCVGRKRWRLLADEYADDHRPTGPGENFQFRQHRLLPPCDREFDMTPGDILYLPRGVMHQVARPTCDSLHITFGVHTLTVAELADRALRLATKEVDSLQAPVPDAMRRQATVADQCAADLAADIATALSRHLAAALEGYRREFTEAKLRAPAEHWFAAHRTGTDGPALLGAAIARRIRNREMHARSSAIQPKHRPKANG